MKHVFTTKDFNQNLQPEKSCGVFCRFKKNIIKFLNKLNMRKYKIKKRNSYPKKELKNKKGIKNIWPRIKYKFQNDKRGFFLKIAKILGIIFLIGLFIIIGIFAFAAKDLPEPGKINTRTIDESTKIYDRTGEIILYDIHGEEKRTIIPQEEIPLVVKQATIALEDENFYNHFGFDVKGLTRAVLSNIFGIGQSVGGSTITQQFVKNSILTNERSYSRKIKELILAIEIEMKFSKEEILGMYLNEIPYGSNAYGIEAAAQTFFNKNAKDLTLDEATTLASLPKSPTRFSPYGSHQERLKMRQEYALDQMVDLGYISSEGASDAKSVDVFAKLSKNKENIKAPHFVFYIREYLEEKYGYEYLEKSGLKVITTLDWEKQEKAEQIVKEIAFENKEKYQAENASLVAINPKNGDILTMVGSRDYFDEEIDGQVNVSIRERQPGSSFKPYAYLHAFEKGYTPETVLFDTETEFNINEEAEYKPQNYDGTFRGPVKIKESLGMSLNIPAVKALYLAGPKEVIAFAKRLGITSLNDSKRYGLSVVLGGGEVQLVDHVAAYSVLANEGIKFDKRSILKIEDKNGEIIEEAKNSDGEEIVDKKYITMLSHILSHNKYRAEAFGENNPLKFEDGTVAAKTGTTNENRDAWTMGYTPQIAIGVWGGNNDNTSMTSAGVGTNVAAPIFKKVLLEVFSEYIGEEFSKYDKDKEKTDKDILDGDLPEPEKIEVCEIPGKDDEYCKANKYCPEDKIKKRKFADIHNILYYVKKDDPQGDKPENPKDDPQYKNWEKGVKKFYEDDDKIIFEDKPDDCEEDDFDKYKPEISLSIPDSISENKITLKTNINSPYDIEKIEFFADDELIKDGRDDSFEYKIPNSKNDSKINFKVRLTDSAGNTTEDNKEVKISIPEPSPDPDPLEPTS